MLKDYGDGREAQEVGKVGANGSFGELALLYNTPRSATVIAKATGKPHITWTLDRETFHHVLKELFSSERARYARLINLPLFAGTDHTPVQRTALKYCRAYE